MIHLRLCLFLGAVFFTACAQPSAGAKGPTTPASTNGAESSAPAASSPKPRSAEPEQLDAAKPSPAVEGLLAQLESPEVDKALDAAEALGRIPSAERVSVDFLARKLESPEEQGRAWAVALLGRTGFPSAIPVLIRALADEEHNVHSQASSALSNTFGMTALAPLMAALEDANPRRRAMAALTLRDIGPKAHDALPRLRALTEDADVEVHENALLALGALSTTDEDKSALLSLLLQRLDNENPRIRNEAIFVLHHSLGQRFPQVIPRLIQALSDKLPSVQIEAALALGEFGPAARAAVPRLRQLATKPVCVDLDGCVDVAAREALGRISGR